MMATRTEMDRCPLQIGRYQLHPVQGLADNGREIHVTPRSLAVLTALARQPGRIVTKEDLFRTVWAGTVVTDSALTSCIRELRRALQDDARNPRYIETVHRRGYRLLVDSTKPGRTRSAGIFPDDFPGRADALERLSDVAARVSAASTETVVITGPPNAGKSPLVQFLIDRMSRQGGWLAGHAFCSDPADACRPLIDMLEQLCQGPDGMAVSLQLRREAPAWLAELASVLTQEERHALIQKTSGATAQWRNCELRRALTSLTVKAPLMMCFENVDQCDEQTLEFLVSFLRETEEAPVLLLLTCRCANKDDSVGSLDTLRATAGRFTEIELDPLIQDFPQDASRKVRRQLDRQETIARRALEAGSVAGIRFTSAEVAAAMELPESETTVVLRGIGKQSSIVIEHGRQTWPDGTATTVYAFRNPADRAAILELVPFPVQIGMHRRIGRRLEDGWAKHRSHVVSRLAWHYERAGHLGEAVECRYRAGAIARRRGSHAVALKNFRRAQVLLESAPSSHNRDEQTAMLCTAIGRELTLTQGLDSTDAIRLYTRGLELVRRLPASADLCNIAWRLWVFYMNRGPLHTASELARRLLELGRHLDDPAVLLQAYHARWATAFMLGDMSSVLEQTRLGMAVCGSGVTGSQTMTTGCTLHDAHLSDHHAGICAGFFGAWAEGMSGHEKSALTSLDAAISHARDIGHPFTLALTLTMAAGALAACAHPGLVQVRTREARCIARRRGFTALQAWASIYEGWARVELGDPEIGMNLLRGGLSVLGESGMTLFRPFHLVLAAAAQLKCGRLEGAGEYLEQAFGIAARTGDRLVLAEMHRLRAELNWNIARDGKTRRRVEEELQTAADIARSQGAVLWEDRATASLERFRVGRVLSGHSVIERSV